MPSTVVKIKAIAISRDIFPIFVLMNGIALAMKGRGVETQVSIISI